MKKIKKLRLNQTRSNFERLCESDLSMLLGGSNTNGGASCGATGSSCDCDATAVCNCPIVPIIPPYWIYSYSMYI